LDWGDLQRRTIEADKELERIGLNPAKVFRKHRKNNNVPGMNQYIGGFYRYPFCPSYSDKNWGPQDKPLAFHTSTNPDRDTLVTLYHELKDEHPGDLLPLETELPSELQRHSRDQFRTVLTMILSERSNDHNLSKALGRLFQRYPDFGALQFLSRQQIVERILSGESKGGCGFGGYNKPNGGGSDDRMTTFLSRYFEDWKMIITEQHICDLEKPKPTGFDSKFIRTLLAYCPLDGNGSAGRNVLPLDNPAFTALNDCLRERGYQYRNEEDAREDIENKLGDEKGISLIDFHELLRFRGQTGGRDAEHLNSSDSKVIIGWNTWRLLCSNKRGNLTEAWISNHLITGSRDLAKELWRFYNKVAHPTGSR
jgi:hypothetical protein